MKTIKFVYFDREDLKKFNEIVDPTRFNIEIYNESDSQTKRKATLLKGQFGTKISPFAVIYDNDMNATRVFYREQGDTLYHLNQYLNHPIKIDEKVFNNFVKQCKEYELSLTEVIEKIKSLYYGN